MLRFAANLTLLYNEYPFLDRFAAAARDGFRGVEFLFPYAFDPKALAQALRENDLQQVLFNAPPGNWDAGERGLACLSGRQAEFRAGFEHALEYADALSCPRLHVMAGIAPSGSDRAELQHTFEDNLAWAAEQARGQGCEVLIEPINTRDFPGYFLNRQDAAHAIVQTLNQPNLKVQFDLYHCQIVEGDVASKISQYLPTGRIGHFQIAGVPERQEPSIGELNYPYLLKHLDEVASHCGWQGWVGCEYRPARGAVANATSQGLGWLTATNAGIKG